MAQADLVAALRTHKRAEERAKKAREALEAEMRRAVLDGDWQIIDVAALTGWSRETVRKIVHG
jgi:transcriptional regulator of acetoin/glycerol metabolism